MGIGDEIIVTGQVRNLQLKDPRKVRITYERGLRWYDVWDRNPRIATREESGDFQVFLPRHQYLRPYCAEKSAGKWKWKPWQPPRGEFYFADAETNFGRRHGGGIVIQPAIKSGAPPGKQWGKDRWHKLVRLLLKMGHRVTVIGASIDDHIPGVREIQTRSIRMAATMMQNAAVSIIQEGALHHAAAAVGAKAVVIYGGYISPLCVGYPEQTSLFVGTDLGCGVRLRCRHCEAAMSKISPEEVAAQAERMIGESLAV